MRYAALVATLLLAGMVSGQEPHGTVPLQSQYGAVRHDQIAVGQEPHTFTTPLTGSILCDLHSPMVCRNEQGEIVWQSGPTNDDRLTELEKHTAALEKRVAELERKLVPSAYQWTCDVKGELTTIGTMSNCRVDVRKDSKP